MPEENIDISVPLVRSLLGAQFPQWADLPIEPVEFGGWDNRTFRLGETMSVRLPSAEAYAPQVEKEQRWLPKFASLLPLSIPVPLAKGMPTTHYPWHWSIYQWLEGENTTFDRVTDPPQFATMLAHFLVALRKIDSDGGPPPGNHNFFRGAPLRVYDAETRKAVANLDERIDGKTALEVWESSLKTIWHKRPVWFHGDVTADNLLIRNGQLKAVIDFGCLGIGDPACDLTVAWTLLSGQSREVFRSVLSLDEATWARGRGWALWKALITLERHIENNSSESRKATYIISEVINEHKMVSANSLRDV